MADLSSPSFIPKQNPAKAVRRSASRQVYLFTLFSYVIIVAALIAVVALFFYQSYTKKVLASEVVAYNAAIASFDADKLGTVVALSERLNNAALLLDQSIGMQEVFKFIESITIDTVQFGDLTVSLNNKNTELLLEGEIITDSFDSVLFQREIYEKAELLTSAKVTDVSIVFPAASSPRGQTVVSFSTTLNLNSNKLPTQSSVRPTGLVEVPAVATSSISTSSTTTSTSVSATSTVVRSSSTTSPSSTGI